MHKEAQSKYSKHQTHNPGKMHRALSLPEDIKNYQASETSRSPTWNLCTGRASKNSWAM